MSGPGILCTKCGASLPAEVFNTSELTPCPGQFCESLLQVEVFPACFRPLEPGSAGERIVMEGQSGCFYHPQKRAAVPCEACGRFLCDLCDVQMHGHHLCPRCLETGAKKGMMKDLQNHRVLYDSAALSLALLPLLFWPLTLLASPVAVFMGFRYWKAPSSILPRTKIRLVLAIIIGLTEFALWVFVLVRFVIL
jgi:hypothetical protein